MSATYDVSKDFSPASGRDCLVALGRTAAVAAVGLAMWIAVSASASGDRPHDAPALTVNAPQWTYSRSIEVRGAKPERIVVQAICDFD